MELGSGWSAGFKDDTGAPQMLCPVGAAPGWLHLAERGLRDGTHQEKCLHAARHGTKVVSGSDCSRRCTGEFVMRVANC